MYCVYCNHPLKGDEKECPSCGRPSGTFVQMEAFRNGKGQKAAATSLSELTLSERPEDSLAKISAMAKEIKALRQENEELKKEQINLRALVNETKIPPEKTGGVIPALIAAAVAALIPLIALAVIFTGFGKRTADLEQKLLETTGRAEATETALNAELETAEQYPASVMSERIDAAQQQIVDLQSSVAGLEKEIEELRSIIEGREEEEVPEAATEDTTEDGKEVSDARDAETSEESAGEISADAEIEDPGEHSDQTVDMKQDKATTGA